MLEKFEPTASLRALRDERRRSLDVELTPGAPPAVRRLGTASAMVART
jgi:hypothetical protein